MPKIFWFGDTPRLDLTVTYNFRCLIRKQVQSTRHEAEKDGVTIPMTLEDYCVKTKVRSQDESIDMTDFYVDDFDDSDDFVDSELEDADDGNRDDSGNEES